MKKATVLLSRDFHPPNHCSFVTNNPGAAPFSTVQLASGPQVMWPPHCVQLTEGAQFVSSLVTKKSDAVILKGVYPQVDSYSAFGDANGHSIEKTSCDAILRNYNITHVVICGLALDYCVSYSARDAAAAGFKTYVVLDACRGIAQESIDKEIALMTAAGVTIVESMDGLPADLLH